MRILITGSRTWDNSTEIFHAINLCFLTNPPTKNDVVVTGGAIGADVMAEKVAHMLGCIVETHLPRWEQHQPDCPPSHQGLEICKRAGFIRNAYMVALGADICLAFIKNESKGAIMTANLAERAGIPVRRYVVND